MRETWCVARGAWRVGGFAISSIGETRFDGFTLLRPGTGALQRSAVDEI
jgi:hypothetical protein